MLKGEKMDDIVRDAVMLGVAAIQPIVTKRSEMTVAALLRSARVDRWKRVALASVKQSQRAVCPEIRTPLAFETLLDEPKPTLAIMLVEPAAGADVETLAALRGDARAGGRMAAGRTGRRMDRGGMDGRARAWRAPDHVRASHAPRRRRPRRRHQRAAVSLGRSVVERVCRPAIRRFLIPSS